MTMAEKRPRKRNRTPFSCTNCRQGKYRCDRQRPCSTCLRRSEHLSCQYDEMVLPLGRINMPNDIRPETRTSEHNSIYNSPNKLCSFLGDQFQNEPATQISVTSLCIPGIDRLGYSKSSTGNIIDICERIEHLSTSGGTRQSFENSFSRRPDFRAKYRSLVRCLPSRPYVSSLVDMFFTHVNWQYCNLDPSYFTYQTTTLYNTLRYMLSEEHEPSSASLSFPGLLFQVIASALQFVPPQHDQFLDDLRAGTSFDGLSNEYYEFGLEIFTLLGPGSATLASVQAGFLRACFLKQRGDVIGSWHSLGHTIIDAKDIRLDQEDAGVKPDALNDVCAQLWHSEDRRRTMMNLIIWDSQLGVILGKPPHMNVQDCRFLLPLDTAMPSDRTKAVPSPRDSWDKPDIFTYRLVEYQLQRKIPELRALVAEGPYPKNYKTVESCHQMVMAYISNLPPYHNFNIVDKTWDTECPWLVWQRECLCSTTWLFLMALHRTYLSSIAQSRTETIRAALQVLWAQERLFNDLPKHYYGLFTLVFFTLEPSLTLMAAFIASPGENGELFISAIKGVKKGLSRLGCIRASNSLAISGINAIQPLLKQIEGIREYQSLDHEDINCSTSHMIEDIGLRSPRLSTTTDYSRAISQTQTQYTLTATNTAQGLDPFQLESCHYLHETIGIEGLDDEYTNFLT